MSGAPLGTYPVDEFLAGYAEDLNDAEPGHEFTIWSREQLLRYHNEGLCLVAALRPDMFTKTVVVKVTPCVEEQSVCDCTVVHKVLGQADSNGRILRPLRLRNTKTAMVWTGKKCAAPRQSTVLKEYSVDSGTNKVSVYPPVSSGVEAWIKIECTSPPEELTLDSPGSGATRCAFAAAVLQWVLYRAKEIDEMSPALRAAAKDHFATFGNILGLVKASDDTYRSILKAARR
jgi:hypothetical protein